MRENGKFLQMIVHLFKFEKAAEHRLPAAAIEQIASFDCRSCAGGHFDVDLRAIVFESDVLHGCFFADFGAVFTRVIEQELVELGASDLIGAIASRAETIFEVKFYAFGAAGRDNFAPKLWKERAVEFFAHAEAIECFCAKRQE